MGNYTVKITYELNNGQGARQKAYTVTAADPDNAELRAVALWNCDVMLHTKHRAVALRCEVGEDD